MHFVCPHDVFSRRVLPNQVHVEIPNAALSWLERGDDRLLLGVG
jgi:hypothetical protein